MRKNRMDFWNLAIRIIFLSQTTIGLLGNFSLIFYYVALYYEQCTLKPTDLILMHLMGVNALIILSSGIPQTMAAFGLKQFLNDFLCKLLLYFQGFFRNLSIGTICLLSVFQAMTISPRESCWKNHNAKAKTYIGCSISFLWILYVSINLTFSVHTFINRDGKNATRKRDFGYCSIVGRNEISDLLYTALVVCPEIFFSVLVAWSSMSMIIILYRHKLRVQHIRSTHSSSRTSPDSRATQNILLLVSTFLVFYTLSSIFRGCIALLNNQNWWLMNITPLTSLSFPAFGPFVLRNPFLTLSRLIWSKSGTKMI
ncbi:vomeronasal type-1 receptor 4-like [Meriones unguiculatus]|uniref:vomeronasal type-1 receptor 4-like n=1 Tax=Meriones unguiculatus TaxID=10047 RepID=UPI000B4F34FC|nr:vomeronasal type-1 receptor 4-like [Meriones unguiculatus]